MKVLIIGPSWVGDMVMSHSLYRVLHALHPNITIDVMAPDWCRALLKRMPEVKRAINLPFEHGIFAFNQRRQLGLSLRQQNYTHAYILPNSFKSALIPFFARIPIRTGWKGEMRYGLLNDIRKLNKKAFPLMVQRYIALAYPKGKIKHSNDLPMPIPWPKFTVKATQILDIASQFRLDLQQKYIGFCPGAEFGPAKRWPHYHYATLANLLIKQGYYIILFGSDKDRIIGETIQQHLGKQHIYCLNFAGKTTLDQAIDLIAYCQAVVTNDSGLMHVAAAVNTPLVALYGPSSPNFTPPLSNQAKVIRLISGYHKIRTADTEQGYHQSLININPQLVLENLQTLLQTTGH